MIADGFFEWKQTMVGKVPMRVVLRFGEPFAFAGLWETWRPLEGECGRFLHHHHHGSERVDGADS